MTTKRKRPAWVRDARKAIAAHLPEISKAMAKAAEPHELAIVPRGMDWEDCASDNAAAAQQMLRFVNLFNRLTYSVADAVTDHLQEVTGRYCTRNGRAEPWTVEAVLEECTSDNDWIDDLVADRWQEAINELPEREDDV